MISEKELQEAVDREIRRRMSEAGKLGGAARAKKLTPRQRSMAARKAGKARQARARAAKEEAA
jgi:hypothetical protein